MRLAISVLIAAVFLCGVSTAFTIPDQPAHKPGTPAGSAAATIAGSASSSVPTVTAAEAAPIKSSFPVIVEHSFVFPDLPSSHSAISLGAFTPRGSGSGSITLPSPSGGRFGSASLPALELSRAQAELLVPALQAEVAALAEDYPSKAEAPVGVDAPSSHASAKGGVVAQVAAPGPLYMLRVSDKSTGATATVSASLCHLLSSSLASPAVAGSSPGTGAGEGKESLVIDVTSFGTIAGAFYNVPPSPARPYLAGLCLQALSQLNRALASASASAADTVMRFGLTIRVRAPKDGGKPVTLGITEPMAPAAVAAATAGASSHPTSSDGKAAPEEEKSFLAKYWMYLVPFLLVSVASNLMAPADEPAESAAAEGGASDSDKQQSQGSTKKGPATKKA